MVAYLGQPVILGEPIGMQSGGEAETLQSYLAGLTGGAGLMFRLNSTTTVLNQLPTANLDGTVQGTPSLVDSPYGEDQGLALDANGKRIRVANHAAVASLGNAASFTVIARLRLASSPGNTTRMIYSFENSNHSLSISTADKLSALRSSAGGTNGSALSTDSIAHGSNVMVASVFSPADKSNAFRMYTGATTFAEMALTTDVTLTVALGQMTTQNLYFGDRALGDFGLMAEMCDVLAFVPIGMTLAQLNGFAALLPH
jgi:hypothetical protein